MDSPRLTEAPALDAASADAPALIEGWVADSAEPEPSDIERVIGTRKAFRDRARKRVTTLVIAILVVALAGLVWWLYYLLTGNPMASGARRTELGIRTDLVISGPGQGEFPRFSAPMSVAWAPDGRRFYVADADHNRICVFSRSGRFLGEFGGFGIAKPLPGVKATWKPGNLNYPVSIAVDQQGRIYVADFYNDSISVFSAQGRFVRRFPDPTKQVGKGSSGQDGGGIAVTAVTVSGGLVYATDKYQIFIFKQNGTLVGQFGMPGTAPGSLDHPGGLAVDASHRIFVSDSNNSRIQAFDASGTLQWVVDSSGVVGRTSPSPWTMMLPRGMSLVGTDRLLVADSFSHSLLLLSREGKPLAVLGTRGVMPAQLNFPNDVAWLGDHVLIADRQNNRVQLGSIVRQR